LLDDLARGRPLVNRPLQTADELLDLLAREQVVAPDPLWQYLADRGGAAGLPDRVDSALDELTAAGLLTTYQAEQIRDNHLPGLFVGKYLLLDRLGGPDSSVYRARKRPNGSQVAVKVLPHDDDAPAVAYEPQPERHLQAERFRREAEALARLDHPGVVGIKEFGEDSRRLFFVMELIPGRSLADLVAEKGPLAPAPAARIIQEALQTLAHVHQSGIIHRDLRPAHLLLDSSERVHILDLGLARFLEDRAGALTRQSGEQVLGSVEYLAPEQILDSHDVDVRTDVYGLGATLYFLLTGKPPFNHHSILRLAAGVVTHPQPLAQLCPDAPKCLVAIVEKMMAAQRADRYATAAEAALALQGWLLDVAPPPLKTPHRTPTVDLLPEQPAGEDETRLGWGVTLLLAGALAALAGLAFTIWREV
jgi:serine/threonine protein kinase